MRRSIACATVVVGCFALPGILSPARGDGIAVGYRQLGAVDVPDGGYVNLVDGKAFLVKNGQVFCDGKPIIFTPER